MFAKICGKKWVKNKKKENICNGVQRKGPKGNRGYFLWKFITKSILVRKIIITGPNWSSFIDATSDPLL